MGFTIVPEAEPVIWTQPTSKVRQADPVMVRTQNHAGTGMRGARQLLKVMAFMCLGSASALGAETPVTPGASAEVQSLLAYFSDIYGKKILSGQQEGWRGTNELGPELTYLKNTTGELPALLALDFSPCTKQAPHQDTQHQAVKSAIDWYNHRNGVVAFCWHWYAPLGEKAFYTKDTHFNLSTAMTEGTAENKALLRDLDVIAGELKLLRNAHVPVLWRPLHEVNGRWFWWGAQGPEPYKKLWRLMFERFTVKHGLNNLIWVFSPGAETDLADWYPGDEYVDMIGQDHYPMDGNNGPAKDVFDELTMLGRGTKMLAMSENGAIPDPDRLVSEKAGWLFFTTWTGRMLTERNSNEQLIKIFHHPYVINLDGLPRLKDYPFKAAGKPVKLAFPAPPGDVSVGGVRRHPVTVAVEDEEGRIVREGSYIIRLALGANAVGDTLHGTLSAKTVNGIATFPDLKLNEADSRCALNASADGLKTATSGPFEVGPGAGILCEWFTNLADSGEVDLAKSSRPPDGRGILTGAFEVPVRQATHFAALFRGYIIPPQSGAYTLWLANEGTSELWLSRDETETNTVKIATVTGNTPYSKWPHTHESGSVPVTLEAGHRYYLEVRQKQVSGSVQIAVRWRLPDGTEERPIPGWRLLPCD